MELDLSHRITIYHLHEYVLLFEVLFHVFVYFFLRNFKMRISYFSCYVTKCMTENKEGWRVFLRHSLIRHEQGAAAWAWSSRSHCKCGQRAERSARWGSAKFLFCILRARTLARYVVPPTLRVDLPFSVNTDMNTAENPSRTCPEVCSHDSKSYQVDDQDQPPKVKHVKSFKNNKLSQTLKHCTQDSHLVRDHP